MYRDDSPPRASARDVAGCEQRRTPLRKHVGTARERDARQCAWCLIMLGCAKLLRHAVLWLTVVVVIWRGGMLVIRPGGAFDGVGERRWFTWAYRRPDLRQLFAAVRVHAQAVTVIVPEAAPDVGWWTVMALYYLPQCRFVAIRGCGTCSPKGRIAIVSRMHTRS